MNHFLDPEQLATAWRQLADTANENGETPLLALGVDSLYRNSWLNLLALNRIAGQNLGAAAPDNRCRGRELALAGCHACLATRGCCLWTRGCSQLGK